MLNSRANRADQHPNAFKGKIFNTSSLNPDVIIGPVFEVDTYNSIFRNITNGEVLVNVEPQIIKGILPTDFNANIAHASYGSDKLILRKDGVKNKKQQLINIINYYFFNIQMALTYQAMFYALFFSNIDSLIFQHALSYNHNE